MRQYELHDRSNSVEYNLWKNIRSKCYNQGRPEYIRYGAKGIRVCDEWLHSFSRFYEDMGPRPSPQHVLRRIDEKGDFTKDNCQWVVPLTKAIEGVDDTPSPTTRDDLAGAYIITHVASGKIYIGSSGKLQRRKTSNLSKLKRRVHHSVELQELYDESPLLEWEFFITEDRQSAFAMEQKLINDLLPGGNVLNRYSQVAVVPDDSRKPTIGHRTPEHTAKLADARRGTKLSLQWRQRISESLKKAEISEESKARILAASRRHTEEIQVPVMVDGVDYPSCQHAAEALNLPYDKVFYRTRSPLAKWANYVVKPKE